MSDNAKAMLAVNGAALVVSIVAQLPGFALLFFFLLAISAGLAAMEAP